MTAGLGASLLFVLAGVGCSLPGIVRALRAPVRGTGDTRDTDARIVHRRRP